MTYKPIFWHPDVVKRFVEEYNKGRTHTELSEMFSKTRNACIGLAHRLHLKPRRDGTQRPNNRPRLKLTQINTDVVQGEVKLSPRPPILLPPQPQYKPIFVKFWDLRTDHCRWPMDKEVSLEMDYCGAPVIEGSSYCEHHHKISINERQPKYHPKR